MHSWLPEVPLSIPCTVVMAHGYLSHCLSVCKVAQSDSVRRSNLDLCNFKIMFHPVHIYISAG